MYYVYDNYTDTSVINSCTIGEKNGDEDTTFKILLFHIICKINMTMCGLACDENKLYVSCRCMRTYKPHGTAYYNSIVLLYVKPWSIGIPGGCTVIAVLSTTLLSPPDSAYSILNPIHWNVGTLFYFNLTHDLHIRVAI